MKRNWLTLCLGMSVIASMARAQVGPFPPEDWPATADPNKVVHFVSVESVFTPLGAGWSSTLNILSGGDQVTSPLTIGGFPALKVTGNYLNTADSAFADWATNETIDILMQVYGDAAVLNAQGQPRNFSFLTGVLPELAAPSGGMLPVEARNSRWNWVLFRIPNGLRASDGTRFVGSIPANAQGGFQAGGVNGGTIRLEGAPNLIARVVAFGERGAFGEPEQINTFLPPQPCDPEPNANYAWIDLSTQTSNHLALLNNGDQIVTFADRIGPTNDQRRAARPNGSYMNFGITSNFLGQACNDSRTVKLCVEFYDDPALVGTVFGPEAYATDAVGGIGFYPVDRRHTLTGTGKWVRRSFVVPAVSLAGVNTAPLTGGPRLAFAAPVFISRFDLAVLRVSPHPLAGQDPLADCVEDLNICTDAYGSFVEMDLATGTLNGLAPGTSGGDQEMIQAEAGPLDDRRLAIRPAREDGAPGFAHSYLNLAIVNQALGPSSQPNARLAICVTYYDDPALAGQSFRPEVYQSDRNGLTTFAFTPGNIAVMLQGTDRWRETYFELPDVKFQGVNQGPQAAARFFLTGKIFFSRVRYAVIRPCGPNAGVNQLEDCKGVRLAIRRIANNTVRLSWSRDASGFTLQVTDNLTAPNWIDVTTVPTEEGSDFVVTQPIAGTKFYRLSKPL